MASSACSRSRSRLRRDRGCCCSTSRRPECPRRRAPSSSPPSRACRARSPCSSSSTTWRSYSGSRAVSTSWSAAASWCRERRTTSPGIHACGRFTWERRTVSLLELHDVRAGYGDSVVLDGLSLELAEGGSLAVLGRNGAGKSTLLLTIMGFTSVRRGRIVLREREILGLPAHRRAQLGIGWVAQERDIFPSLSVVENLTVAARPGQWSLDRVYRLFPRLEERRSNRGNQLSGGEQQMLAIARALMTNPALLLLDEPLEGLAPIIVEELASALKRLQGVAIVLLEQNAEVALALTEQAVAIERGRIVHRAPSAEFARDAPTLERYVGLKLA